MTPQPPKWADRFLEWYCKPDLLEEIQGDAYELYCDRLERQGKRMADVRYLWDVIRFLRWSNIRVDRQNSFSEYAAVCNFNLKIAGRNAKSHKTLFAIKIACLSLSLAFSILLGVYVANEITFDHYHINADRLYRVTSVVDFNGQTTHYAVTPLPTGTTLHESVPEIEKSFRFTYEGSKTFKSDKNQLQELTTLSVDTNFLSTLSYVFEKGNEDALKNANTVVLTQSAAKRIFGDNDGIGKILSLRDNTALEVTAIIEDPPVNSHLHFDALISWETFGRPDDWGDLNAYTYVLLRNGVNIEDVKTKISAVVKTFHQEVAREYDATLTLVLEKITDIHFSALLDEDVADKKNKNSVFILACVCMLFTGAGITGYFNLTLAEVNANSRRIGILRAFGDSGATRKLLFTDTIFSLLIVVPLTAGLVYTGWYIANSQLSIYLNPTIFHSSIFIICNAGLLLLILALSQGQARFITVISNVAQYSPVKNSSVSMRKLLVGVQVSFSIVILALMLVVNDQLDFILAADKGFDDKNAIVIKIPAGDAQRANPLMEDIRNLNGVENVESSSYFPGVIETKYVFQIETENGVREILVPMIHCGPDYLSLLNIDIANGRNFDPTNTNDSNHGFIINESAVREFNWTSALGKRINGPVTGQGELEREGEVIGVVRDFNFNSLHTNVSPLIIVLSDEYWGTPFVYIKTKPLHHPELMSSIQASYKKHYPDDVFNWEHLEMTYRNLYKRDTELKKIFMMGLFLTSLISCLNIFSMSALLYTMRRKEMGIRKIVGASAVQIFFLHASSFAVFVFIAILCSWPLIWFMTNVWLQTFAYHITPGIWYFIVPSLMALIITTFTSMFHSARSSRINPIEIIRHT